VLFGQVPPPGKRKSERHTMNVTKSGVRDDDAGGAAMIHSRRLTGAAHTHRERVKVRAACAESLCPTASVCLVACLPVCSAASGGRASSA
jgi:hypothetical protein